MAGVGVATLATVGIAQAQQDPEPITLGWYPRYSWVSDEQKFRIKDVHDTGTADALTHLGYAFAEIDAEGACDPETEWGDYNFEVGAADSVDGVGDTNDQRLWGQFNQLRKLEELHPDLKVLISVGGGGGEEDPEGAGPIFEEIAADPATRATFIENCIDTFLRGNLPPVDMGNEGMRGGPGSAAGIFDGIDIDWEWAQDATRANYTALHAEFRDALDAAEVELGREFTLSTTFPDFVDNEGDGHDGYDVPELFAAVDFAHIQVYSMYAPWTNEDGQVCCLDTAFHSQHRDDPERNPYSWNASGEQAVEYLIDHGAPPEKIIYGVGAFGHGWTGVPDIDNGVYQTGTDAADDDGIAYDVLRTLDAGTHYLDEHAVSAYYYDGADWIAYDSVETVTTKAEYAVQRGLGGMMMWEMAQNTDGELLITMSQAQAQAAAGNE